MGGISPPSALTTNELEKQWRLEKVFHPAKKRARLDELNLKKTLGCLAVPEAEDGHAPLPAQNQPMVHAPGLVKFQRRKLRHRRELGFI
jgi:hypothetical protein